MVSTVQCPGSIARLLSTVWSSAVSPVCGVHRPASTVQRPPSTVHRPPSTVHRPPSSVHRPVAGEPGQTAPVLYRSLYTYLPSTHTPAVRSVRSTGRSCRGHRTGLPPPPPLDQYTAGDWSVLQWQTRTGSARRAAAPTGLSASGGGEGGGEMRSLLVATPSLHAHKRAAGVSEIYLMACQASNRRGGVQGFKYFPVGRYSTVKIRSWVR